LKYLGDSFSSNRIPPIRNPESTKNRSTPLQASEPRLNSLDHIPEFG
jgi:hypothetical protein